MKASKLQAIPPSHKAHKPNSISSSIIAVSFPPVLLSSDCSLYRLRQTRRRVQSHSQNRRRGPYCLLIWLNVRVDFAVVFGLSMYVSLPPIGFFGSSRCIRSLLDRDRNGAVRRKKPFSVVSRGCNGCIAQQAADSFPDNACLCGGGV